MIKVNKIEPQVVEHFDNNGKSLGFLNEYENLDLRCQIAEQKISGYYMIFNNKKIEILFDGKVSHWDNGLYDKIESLFGRFFKAQR